MAEFKTTKAPNLVISEDNYKIQNEAQFRNQLRLYFNQVDSGFEQILIGEGGSNLSFPHIAASHNADQEADGNDTPTKVLWDTLETSKGFTLNGDSTATAQYSVYTRLTTVYNFLIQQTHYMMLKYGYK